MSNVIKHGRFYELQVRTIRDVKSAAKALLELESSLDKICLDETWALPEDFYPKRKKPGPPKFMFLYTRKLLNLEDPSVQTDETSRRRRRKGSAPKRFLSFEQYLLLSPTCRVGYIDQVKEGLKRAKQLELKAQHAGKKADETMPEVSYTKIDFIVHLSKIFICAPSLF